MNQKFWKVLDSHNNISLLQSTFDDTLREFDDNSSFEQKFVKYHANDFFSSFEKDSSLITGMKKPSICLCARVNKTRSIFMKDPRELIIL